MLPPNKSHVITPASGVGGGLSAGFVAVVLLLVLGCCVHVSTAVMCYQCNSEYDPRCGDPFNDYGLGMVNCSLKDRLEHLRDVEPTLCRKTTQKIFGRVRVVRDCGYVLDQQHDDQPLCLKRSGTFEVQSLFCSCTTDRCNGAARLPGGHTAWTLGLVAAAATAAVLAGGRRL